MCTVRERGTVVLPWTQKWLVLREDEHVSRAQEEYDVACTALVQAAMGNVAIMQVEKNREAHAAVCAFRRLPQADELCRAE
eukprot:213182-Chlamydomonas_euryale.AAC.1